MSNGYKMTTEQQNLLMDNIGVFYKYCVQHHIDDEDEKQSLLLRLCKAMKTYNPENGSIATFMYAVADNERKAMWNQQAKYSEIVCLSLDQPTTNGKNEEIGEASELYGSDDKGLKLIEDKQAFNQVLKKYKRIYPETWERDMEVTKAIVAGKKKLDIVKECHVPYNGISPTFLRVVGFFRDEVE